MRMVTLVARLWTGSVVVAALAPTAAARTEALRPRARPVPRVVVLRRPAVRVYEQVAEEFRSHLRAAVRLVSVGGDEVSRDALRRWLIRRPPDLLFVVGRSAYELLSELDPLPPTICTLVFEPGPSRCRLIATQTAPQASLQAFRTVRPKLRVIGMLTSPRSAEQLNGASDAAIQLGIDIVPIEAHTPAEAIRQLLRMRRQRLDGLWLATDLSIISPQVLQYAIGIQFRRRIPLMGATRRHVSQGALFAVDVSPDAIGRRAASVAHLLLRGRPRRRARRLAKLPDRVLEATRPRLSVNHDTAQRLGIDLEAVRELAGEVLE